MRAHRPTRRALTIAAAAVLIFLAASTAQAGWLFVLAAGVLGLVAGSFLTRHNLNSVEVARTTPRRVSVGTEVAISFSILNGGKRTLPLMRIEDRFPAFDPFVLVSSRIRKGVTARREVTREALRRGAFSSGEVALTTAAPFGFLRSKRSLEVPSATTVVPKWVELRSFPILEPSSYPSDVFHERARTGAGQEYLGVREYRPGDPPRSVHWRSTARVGRLVVREYEEEVQTRVTVVISGGDEGFPPDSSFELLVSAAASIAVYALMTGHPIDLLRPTAGGGFDHLADPDRVDVLDWLAAATPVDDDPGPLVEAAVARGGRRGTIVLLTPTTGRAAGGLERAVRAVQVGGSRAILIVARSSTWSIDPSSVPIEEEEMLSKLTGGRAALRTISRGDDLARSLQ